MEVLLARLQEKKQKREETTTAQITVQLPLPPHLQKHVMEPWEDLKQKLRAQVDDKMRETTEPGFLARKFAIDIATLEDFFAEPSEKAKMTWDICAWERDVIPTMFRYYVLSGIYPTVEFKGAVFVKPKIPGYLVRNEVPPDGRLQVSKAHYEAMQQTEYYIRVVLHDKTEFDVELELLMACAPYTQRCVTLYSRDVIESEILRLDECMRPLVDKLNRDNTCTINVDLRSSLFEEK